ncbi:SRPBCC family protein [Niabella hibiscisoli]|uniref:SRPBCC family protein n=1 Tax=Niabella hibiscisoli TaxID=1825928 RepID=UPI001F0D4BE4|nr:SRPBCC domain-containing protein [Niabella hibiscisoli]MCH5719716.1 SRPBCC domain-containing protein [Niabella hibiscisoli]
MERKTKIHAEKDRQELTITREFDLPVELLWEAHTDAAIIEQWMGNKVLKFEAVPHGGYQFETTDANGNMLFRANGVIHSLIPNRKMVRTFEMENVPFDVQLEYLEFEPLTADTSKLTMQIIYRSVELREQQLKMPFEYGINMAHDRLEKIAPTLK